MYSKWPLILALFVGCSEASPAGPPGPADASGPSGSPCLSELGDTWAPVAPDLGNRFKAALEAARAKQDLPGLAVAIAYRDSRQKWVCAAGLSNLETQTPWLATDESRIGSVTKVFTGAIVMQLLDEGLLSLDDPLEMWVPGWPGWHNGPTLKHLLGHTSGIESYNYVGDFDESSAWTPEELVQWAYDHNPTLMWTPGTSWYYSNTNFILLGMVIEAATGHSYADALRTRLFEPLKLDMRLAVSGDDSAMLVRSYTLPPMQDNSHAEDPSTGWAAGAIVSTPSDLADWIVTLYGGQLLSSATLELMTTPNGIAVPSQEDYGLATFIENDGGDGHVLVGHNGNISGYMAWAYYLEPEQVAVVVMSNRLETNLRAASTHALAAVLGVPYP
jgi:D-alanyl-D-alanine carboxypeptidase